MVGWGEQNLTNNGIKAYIKTLEVPIKQYLQINYTLMIKTMCSDEKKHLAQNINIHGEKETCRRKKKHPERNKTC